MASEELQAYTPDHDESAQMRRLREGVAVMPVERQPISVSQLSELIGVDPKRFIAVEKRSSTDLVIVLEPEEMTQPIGTFPQLTQGKATKKKGGKR